MSSRLMLAWVLCGALALAFAALLVRHPFWAFAALAFALAGAAAARLFAIGRREFAEGGGAATTLAASQNHTAQSAKARGRTARDAAASVPAGELLAAMLDSMREGMLVVDGELRLVASNAAARDLFGLTDGRAAERPHLGELTRNPDVLSAYLGALERGERVEVKVELAGALRRFFDLRVAPLQPARDAGAQAASATAGRSRGAVGIFFDITRLERLERVRQEFLSNVSHELRTPLTAIRAFVETLDGGALDDAEHNRRFLSVIDRNAARMHSLIDDILELSAIEAGTAAVETRPVRLRALTDDVLTALAAHASERSVALNNEVASDTVVYADARRLEQMLTNLCDNAIKFSAEGGAVSITHERAGGRDRISVADAGEGIAPEHIHRIFERFYRVDRARSRALGGTGLGLAIVKHLARAHGGEATVRSAPGAGSTFTIELPHSEQADTDAPRMMNERPTL